MKKKILFLIILVFLLKIDEIGAICDYSTVSRAKSLVNNVNISYSYQMRGNYPYFNVTLNNITPDMYFVDTLTDTVYTYSDTQNGEITINNYMGTPGSYKFYYSYGDCRGTTLGSKYYRFPIYNDYWELPLCSDIKNSFLCQKWVDKKYDYDDFQLAINMYKASLIEDTKPKETIEYNRNILDKIIEFYSKYYYYILVFVIGICGVIIYFRKSKEKIKM